jgi:hypothetical protein
MSLGHLSKVKEHGRQDAFCRVVFLLLKAGIACASPDLTINNIFSIS